MKSGSGRRALQSALVQCIVFSRDRAMQLDAFLKSVRRHVGPIYESITVLYRPSPGRHAQSYSRLRETWADMRWIAESRFRDDLLACIGGSDHSVFHTDDDVFFRSFARPALEDDEVCFTLRLGLNTTYCYPIDSGDELHEPRVDGDRVTWSWRAQGPGAFSYPLALNGHVFRTTDVVDWLGRIEFRNPNELESALQTVTDETRPRMAAFRHSCVVSIPANLVNETFPNRHSAAYDIRALNERFLGGERIDLDGMDFSSINACHQEIPFVFTN
jgi:hypothetical protein